MSHICANGKRMPFDEAWGAHRNVVAKANPTRCNSLWHSLFTLIELIIVVAVIAILVSLLLPSLQKVKEKAKEIQCAANQKQVSVALFMYVNDYDGYSPAPYMLGYSLEGKDSQYWSMNLYLNGYVGNNGYSEMGCRSAHRIFVCPAMPSSSDFTNEFSILKNVTFGMAGLSGWLGYTWCPDTNHDGGYVVRKVPRSSECGWIGCSWLNSNKRQAYAISMPILSTHSGLQDGGFALAHSKRGNMLMVDGHVRNWGRNEIEQFNALPNAVNGVYKFGAIQYCFPSF